MIKGSMKFFATFCLLLLFAGGAFAQLTAPTQTITLSLVGQETLTVACTPATVTFASAPG
jgi:hypothetical protein